MEAWQSVFRDILNLMGQANQKLQELGPQSYEYWLWLSNELAMIEVKYDRNRLVVLICEDVFQFQQEKFENMEVKK
ncbi:hypothetical protein LFYK43_14210 [Ligilactobacillus salitolerans]|uniref:Uncharacterized protein n=1 Tax=Ligilactobacillus salitolerans TaxID=1808352 RepID=A0A401ITV2_9LACO|nr:hypothetical protein [Ligilactobacillus salitolerans]GBG94962.1 hypothetical protein LFYK43_14210 [Ligilactobacillus salitolerans]